MKSMATTLCGPGIRADGWLGLEAKFAAVAGLLLLAAVLLVARPSEGAALPWLTLGSALAGALAAYLATAMLLTLRSTLAELQATIDLASAGDLRHAVQVSGQDESAELGRGLSAWCAAIRQVTCPRCAAMRSWWPWPATAWPAPRASCQTAPSSRLRPSSKPQPA